MSFPTLLTALLDVELSSQQLSLGLHPLFTQTVSLDLHRRDGGKNALKQMDPEQGTLQRLTLRLGHVF